MKKYVLACVFGVTCALVCFVSCKNEAKGNTPTKEPEPKPEQVYRIGDEGPGGGIVFYVSEEGFNVYDGKGGEVTCHYLEMSKDTLGVSKWIPEYSDIDATEIGLGYGKANAYKILNTKTSKELTEDNCAAYRCSKYSTPSTKAGDWWLPSKDELDLIYQSQKDIVLESCKNKWHWSSSECDFNLAWLQNFDSGKNYIDYKDLTKFSVRAVRAF